MSYQNYSKQLMRLPSLFKVTLSKNTSIINALMSFPSSAFDFKIAVKKGKLKDLFKQAHKNYLKASSTIPPFPQ